MAMYRFSFSVLLVAILAFPANAETLFRGISLNMAYQDVKKSASKDFFLNRIGDVATMAQLGKRCATIDIDQNDRVEKISFAPCYFNTPDSMKLSQFIDSIEENYNIRFTEADINSGLFGEPDPNMQAHLFEAITEYDERITIFSVLGGVVYFEVNRLVDDDVDTSKMKF